MGRKKSPLKILSWRLEWLLYLALETLIRLLPLSWTMALGRGLGRLAVYVVSSRMQMVRRYMRLCFGKELSDEKREALARRVMARTGENLFASVKTALLPPSKIQSLVDIEGLEHFQSAKEKGKGVVIILMHTGNWEIMAQIGFLIDPGNTTGAFYRPLNNPYIDQLVTRRRARAGMRLFAKFEHLTELREFLLEGRALGILCDQRVGRHGHRVPFFGRVASFTPMAFILSKRTGSPVLSGSVSSLGDGRWKLTFDPAFEEEPAANVADMARRFERIIRRAPEDYFWLQEQWVCRKRLPFKISGKGDCLQAAQSESVEIVLREVAVVGDCQPAQAIEFARLHRIEGGDGLLKRLNQLHEALDRGLEFIVADQAAVGGLKLPAPIFAPDGSPLR